MPAKRFERELVRGWLHEPDRPSGDGLAITHGASADCETPLLRAVAEAFVENGFWVLRFDLPFRQEGRQPFPAYAARDREGIGRVANALREVAGGRIVLGGHSYGGRQSTMFAAENPSAADALLLLSYPLHPPGKRDQPRTTHFPNLVTPALFAHGTRDPFGSITEMQEALRSIVGRTELMVVERAPHGLPPAIAPELAARCVKFLNEQR